MSTTTKSLPAPMAGTIAYRNAAQQPRFRPSVELAMAMQHNDEGFCTVCGNAVEGIEPDARKDTCPHCSSPNVYGIEHLALMGLVR